MSWADEPWVCLDTETTGFGPTARILEIAAVIFEGGKIIREWSALLFPKDVDWGSEKVQGALKVNKLTYDQLVGKPSFEEILPDLLLEFDCDHWVAHNMNFDRQMIDQELARIGQPVLAPRRLSICTLQLERHFGSKRNKLGEVAARYQVPQDDAHRAVVDAKTCGLILNAMLQGGRVPQEDADMAALTARAANAKGW